MSTTYILLIILYLFTLAGRCFYEWLKRRGRVDPTRHLVFAIVFADMATLWIGWFTLCEIDPYKIVLPAPIRWIGLALTIVGVILFLGVIVQLRALENTKVLVTHGLFAKIRHPAYVGFILWFVAWPIFQSAPISLLLGIPGIACTLYWRHTEQQNLILQFGPAYLEYMKRTWF